MNCNKKKDETQKFCCICKKTSSEVKLKLCGKCKDRIYCSLECQKKDWKNHKFVCYAKCSKGLASDPKAESSIKYWESLNNHIKEVSFCVINSQGKKGVVIIDELANVVTFCEEKLLFSNDKILYSFYGEEGKQHARKLIKEKCERYDPKRQIVVCVINTTQPQGLIRIVDFEFEYAK